MKRTICVWLATSGLLVGVLEGGSGHIHCRWQKRSVGIC